jgi:hypothetical protein
MLTDEQFWLKAGDNSIELQAAAAHRRANRLSDACTGEQEAIEPPIATTCDLRVGVDTDDGRSEFARQSGQYRYLGTGWHDRDAVRHTLVWWRS